MDAYDSPPSPLSASPTRPSRRTTTDQTTSRKRSHSKHRSHSHHHHRSSSYLFNETELARLLISEEREARELREAISTLTERLRSETTRADSAEQRLTSTILKCKEVSNARVVVQQDLNRVSEELRLYKLQLDTAQKEINKAQDVIDLLEKERYEAEECAARARSTARKLKEEKLVMHAREEGRKEGLEEGFERGRRLGYEEGRAAGFESGRAAALRQVVQDEVLEPALPPLRPISIRQSRPKLRQTTPPAGIQEDTHVVSPGPSRPPTRVYTSIPTPEPIIVQNVQVTESPPAFRATPAGYIPDGWIPSLGEDKRIRLPPPHEFNGPTTTPTGSPPAGVAFQAGNQIPVLMVPPPSTPNDRNAAASYPTTSASYAPPEDIPFDSESDSKKPRRAKRRSSTESQSTTMSQFEILGPPIAPSARSVGGIERPGSVLSAIVEESQRSSSGTNSPYAPASSPNMGMPLSRPEPHNTISALNTSTVPHLEGVVYTRPHYGAGSQSSDSSPERPSAEETRGRRRTDGAGGFLSASDSPPSRSRSRQTLRSVGSSNGGYNITVEPPSRPDSNQSKTSLTQGQTPAPHLLSALDAEIPLQLPREPPSLQSADVDHDDPPRSSYGPNPVPDPPSTGAPIPSLSPIPPSNTYPLSSDVTSQLPPGFVPMGPPTPTPSLSKSRSQPSLSRPGSVVGNIYANSTTNPLMTPSAIPLPPSTVPSVHRLYTPGPPPASTPIRRTPSMSMVGGSTPIPTNGTADPVVIPLPASTIASYRSLGSGRRYSRTNIQQGSSSDDEDEDDKSTTSSFDSLTTPPLRARKISSATSATTRGGGGGSNGVPVANTSAGKPGSVSGGSKVGRSTPGPTYATAPTPPDVKYPLPLSASVSASPLPPSQPQPSLSGQRTRSRSGSVLSSASNSAGQGNGSGSVLGRAAKVPLPPSTVGGATPQSVYSRLSRKGGSVVGRDR